jgi:hypothetical protein
LKLAPATAIIIEAVLFAARVTIDKDLLVILPLLPEL